jgi:hypothetical protein
MQNLHFLLNKLDKPIFHKNLYVLFFTCLYTHIRNRLCVDDTPYKNMFNGPYNVSFLDSFDGHCGEDQYMLGFVFPYLENLHSCIFCVGLTSPSTRMEASTHS